MNERLNIRFLIVLLASAAVLSAGWTAVHAYQVRRNSGALLAHADRAEQAGDDDRAVKLLGLYLEREPDNVDVRARYALLRFRLARSPQELRQVIGVLVQVVEQDPSRTEVQRKLVEAAAATGQIDTAARHLIALREAFPKDSKLAFQLGQCREASGDYAAAAALFREAVHLSAANLDAASQLAQILRARLGKNAEADAVLDEMVAANKDDYRAYLVRGRVRRETGRSAEADVAEALRLAPEDVEVRLLAADLASRDKRAPEIARAQLRFVLDRRADDPRLYEALAAVELRDHKPEAAVACLRRGLEKIPDHPNLMWNLANVLIANNRRDEARPIVDKIPQGALPFGRVQFLRASLKYQDGFWREAADEIEAIRPALSSVQDLATQADLILGNCLRTIGDDDRAVFAYRRVVAVDPTNPAARFGIVVALLNQGRPDTALVECEELMQMPAPPASGWPLMARLLILQNLRQPPTQRHWERVDAVLERAARAQPNSPAIVILRAEADVGRGRSAEAWRLLEAARDKSPHEADYWVALVELADRADDHARAARLLDEAGHTVEDSVEMRLARGRHLASVGDEQSLAAIPALADGVERMPATEQASLASGLASLLAASGRFPQALALWARATELDPRSLNNRLAVFDVALHQGDEALMAETLDAMRQIEGPDGPLMRYSQARRILADESKPAAARSAEARAILTDVGNKRPNWSRVPLAVARAYELEGSPDKAIEFYRKAIDLGERQLTVVRHLVELLVERGRYVDADQVIRKLPTQSPVFGDMQRIAAEVSLKTNDSTRALEYAIRAVPTDSKNASDQRWLGQVLAAGGQAERAERALCRSVELDERDPAGWVALVQFYTRGGHKDKADEAISRAERRIDQAVAPLALAQCYLAVGKQDKARQLFAAAVKARPEDVVTLQSVADFALRTGNRDEAKKYLRRIVSLKSKDPTAADQAQKLLAVVLASGGNYQDSREALAMVGLLNVPERAPGTEESEDPDEMRTRAVVLATQSRKTRQQEAIRILQSLEKRRPLGNEDQFLLAQLQERVGDVVGARDRMLRLLASDGENPRFLTYQVRCLLRQALLNDAQLWLEKLEQILPDALTTVELKSRLLTARGQGSEVVELIRTHAHADSAATTRAVGELLEELGQPAAAEEYFRRHATLAGTPDGPLELARYLARRRRLDEALRLCASVRESTPPDKFGYACLAVLRAAKAGEGDCLRVDGWLQESLRNDPGSIGVLVCQADLRDLLRRYDEAEALYRKVLKRDPRNLVALNNLAWQLACRQGGAGEALSFAELALEVGGSQPALLDTRALALLANNKPAQALEDLDDATLPSLDRATLASVRFHRARAYLQDGKRTEAQKALRDARAAGLEESELHPLEIPSYREVAALH
jgi:tetratricopeptide (TPR) repeat protein